MLTKSRLSTPPIDADDLDAFRVFAESRSFVVAAKALAITQPAAFLRVRKLSESLGATLYRREGRTLSLTDAGMKTLAHARDVHAASSALRARLAGEDAEPRLVIATGEGALLTLLAASIAELAKGPMKLQVKVLDAASTLEAVRGGTADVGVLPLHAAPDDLHARILARVGFVALMPARHPLARRRSIRPADLAGVPLVVPPTSGPHRLAIERFVARLLRSALQMVKIRVEPSTSTTPQGWPTVDRWYRRSTHVGGAASVLSSHTPTAPRSFTMHSASIEHVCPMALTGSHVPPQTADGDAIDGAQYVPATHSSLMTQAPDSGTTPRTIRLQAGIASSPSTGTQLDRNAAMHSAAARPS